jgi:predicted Zn-dependent protease
MIRLHEKLASPPSELSDSLDALLEIERGEDAATLSLRLAELRKQEGNSEAAERVLERGFAEASANVPVREALIEALLARAAHADAVRVLTRAAEVSPEDPDLFLRLAEAHRHAGSPENALFALDAALAVGASRAAMRRERALVLESTGRADEALAELEAAQLAEGGPADELLSAIERTGVHRESERWALKAADLCAEGGQRARAREFLAPWIERSAESTAVLSRVAKLAAFDRDYALAFEAFQKLSRLEQGPARRNSVINLARVADAAGKADEAIREVEAAIAEGLDAPELRRELGKLYGRAGDRVKQARLLLDEARQAKAGAQADLYLKAAELFAQERANEEALGALEELQKLEPERVEGALLSVRLMSSEGRNDEARRYLHGLLSGDKTRSKAYAKLYQKLAELHLLEDELAEALEPLSAAHQLDKSEPEVALKLGLLAFDLEHNDMAAVALRVFISLKDKAIDTATRAQLSTAYSCLAELELTKGQRTVARRMATRASELNPGNRDAERLLSELNAR